MPSDGSLLLTSSVAHLNGRRAVVLMVAQPDPVQAGAYLLEATLVGEEPLPGSLRLVLAWEGGEQTAALDDAGCARFRGIAAAAVRALQAGDAGAFRLRIEKQTGESDALG